LKTIKSVGGTVIDLSREEQERWAASLPDIVKDLVKKLDAAVTRVLRLLRDIINCSKKRV
jgi:hypothetical protein